MPDDERRVAAHHEAAHAVIGHGLGVPVERVSLDDSHTAIWWRQPVGAERERPDLHEVPRIITLLCGHIADTIADGTCSDKPGVAAKVMAECTIEWLDNIPAQGLQDDPAFVVRVVRDIFPTDRPRAERYITYCATTAERLVRQRWPAIKAVAEALLDQGQLSRDELIGIMRASTRGRVPAPGAPHLD